MKPKMVREIHDVAEENKLTVEPGAKIALAIIRNAGGSVSVIASEDVFMDCDDSSVEQILECVRDTIQTCRNRSAEHVEFVN